MRVDSPTAMGSGVWLVCGGEAGPEEFGEMSALDARQLVELGAAGETVGQHGRAVTSRPDRGEQGGLGDRDRAVVVAALDAEVARQAAAAADRVDRLARVAQQRRVGIPAEDRVLVAVRLRYAGDVRQVGRR